MAFTLILQPKVEAVIAKLDRDRVKLRKVAKCLAQMEEDPRYPGLRSHPYEIFRGPHGETVWESYVENNTPAAWRVWWYYGPEHDVITVVDLGPHL